MAGSAPALFNDMKRNLSAVLLGFSIAMLLAIPSRWPLFHWSDFDHANSINASESLFQQIVAAAVSLFLQLGGYLYLPAF